MNVEEPASQMAVFELRARTLARTWRPRNPFDRANEKRPVAVDFVRAILSEPRHRITVRPVLHALDELI